MNKYYLLFIIVIFLFQCSGNRNSSQVKNNGKEIVVNYQDTKTIINADSIIDEMLLIPLQITNPPIGNIQKLIFSNDKIIIWDEKGKAIWVFNNNGKLISSISCLGKGPKEYISINNVSVTNPNIINIADATSKSIIKYDFDGNFVGRIPTISYLSDYIEKDNYNYIFYHDIVNEDKNKYYLQITDKNGFLSGFFPFSYTRLFGENYFYKEKDNVYFNKSFDNKIYKINSCILSCAYNVNFGIDSFPCHKLENVKSIDDFYNILNAKKYIGNISRICLTENYLTFNYEVRTKNTSDVMSYIYNLRTKRQYNYEFIKTDKYIVAPPIPIATDGEYFYDILESWRLSEDAIKKLSKTYNIVATIDSNPILLKYRYKY